MTMHEEDWGKLWVPVAVEVLKMLVALVLGKSPSPVQEKKAAGFGEALSIRFGKGK